MRPVDGLVNQIKKIPLPHMPHNITERVLPQRMAILLREADQQGKVVFICLLCSLFAIMPVGYHMVVLNVPSFILQDFINSSFQVNFGVKLTEKSLSIIWSITVASQGLGALIGCFLVMPLSKFGTKLSMMLINNAILITGSLFMSLAYFIDFAILLIAGRFLTGIYTGLACAFVPLYVQQISPKTIKGSLSCFMHISVCFGSAIGAIFSLDFMVGGSHTWYILMGLPAIFGAIMMVASFYVPDTPNDLLQNGQYTEAIRSIKFYYDIVHEDEDESIQEYWNLVPEMPQQLSCGEAMRRSNIRYRILLGMIVSATQIFSGSMVAISYSTNMFTAVAFMASLVPFLPALGSIVSILLTIPALQLVESSGRRPLLLNTLILCLISNFLLLIFTLLSKDQQDWWASWGFAISFFLYGIGYNLGTGPVAYFLAGELVPPEAAGVSLGASVAMNWFCSMITTFTYYPLSVAIGGWSYLMFIVPSVLFLLILWRFLPETKYYYKDDTFDERLLNDLGPPTAYGTFDEPEIF